MSLRAPFFRGSLFWSGARLRQRLSLPLSPGFPDRNQSPQPERDPPGAGENEREFAVESNQAAHELSAWEWDWIDLGGEG
jgi:hypothetical protein